MILDYKFELQKTLMNYVLHLPTYESTICYRRRLKTAEINNYGSCQLEGIKQYTRQVTLSFICTWIIIYLTGVNETISKRHQILICFEA